jgi:hypothetical protein
MYLIRYGWTLESPRAIFFFPSRYMFVFWITLYIYIYILMIFFVPFLGTSGLPPYTLTIAELPLSVFC